MTIKFKYKPVRKLSAKANSIEAFANLDIDRVLFSNLQEMHLKDFSTLAKLKQIKAAVLGCFHNDIELLLDILNTPNDNLPYLGVLTFEPLHLLTGLHVLHQKSCTDSILKLINFDCLDYQYQAYGVTPAVEILKMGDGFRDAMRDRILRDIVKAIESTNFTKALRLINFDKEYFKTAIIPNGSGQTLLFVAAKHLSLNTDSTAKIAFLKELIQNYGFDVNAIDINGQNCAAFVTGLINNLQTLDAPIPDLGILDGISTAINFASYSTTMHKHTYINIKNNELTREILLLSMQQRYKLTTAEQEALKQRQLFNLRPSVLNLFITKAQIFDLDISYNLAKFIVEHIYPCVAAIDLQRCTFTDNAAELLIEGLRDDPVIEYVDFETTNLSKHQQLLLSEAIKTLPTPVLAQKKLEERAKAAALAPKTAMPPEKPRSAELQAISEIKDIEERVKQHLAYEMRENEKKTLENIKIFKQSKINLAIDVLAGNFASSSVDALNGADNCFEVLTTILSSQIYVHSNVGDLAPIKKYGSKTLSKIIYLVEENNVYYGYLPNLKIIVPNIPDELNLFRACMHASLSILPTPHITNWGMDDICPIQLRNIAIACGANVQAILREKTNNDYIYDFANCNLERLQGIINNLVVEHYTKDIDKPLNTQEPTNDDIALIRHKANILKAQDYHAIFAAYEKESKEIHKYRTTASLERTKALYDISEKEKNYAIALKMIREAIAACASGDLATIRQLKYEHDDKVWQTFCASLPLVHALKTKQTHIVAYLLDNDVDYLNIVHKNTKEFNLAARLAATRSFDPVLLDTLVTRLSQDLLDEQHAEQGVLPFPEYTDLTDKQKDDIVFFCKILISASESIEQKSLSGLVENNLTVLNQWALASIKAEKSAVQTAHLQQMQLIAKHDARLSLQYVKTLADVDEHFVKLVNDNIEAYNVALKKFLAEQQRALDDYKKAENEAKRTAARKKYQKYFKIIAGIGAGVFLTPFVAPAFSGLGAFATAVLEGATFSFISTGIAGGNPLKSAVTGGAFAGLGHLVGKALDVTKINDIMKDAVQAASSASLHSAIYGGKLFDNVAFSVGGSVFGNYAVPKGVLGDANKLTRQALRKRIIENTVRAAVTAVPVTMLHGGNLADSLAAGAMGAASAAVGGFGADLGTKAASAANDVKSPPVAKDSVKPTATKTKASVLPKQTKASTEHTMPNTTPRATTYSHAPAAAKKQSLWESFSEMADGQYTEYWEQPRNHKLETETIDKFVFKPIRKMKEAIINSIDNTFGAFDQTPGMRSMYIWQATTARIGLSIIPDTPIDFTVNVVMSAAAKPAFYLGKQAFGYSQKLYYVGTMGSTRGQATYSVARALNTTPVVRDYATVSLAGSQAYKPAMLFSDGLGYGQVNSVSNAKNGLLFSKHYKIDFAPTAYLDGQLYSPDKQLSLVNYLYKRGVDVYPTSMLPAGSRFPGFTARNPYTGRPTLFLPENPTVLEVKHELSHWLDYKNLGIEKYSQLSKLEKEQMVLYRLENHRDWKIGKFNNDEKKFSKNYVEKIKREDKLKKYNGAKNVD